MEAMSRSAASGIGGAPPQVRGVIRKEAEGDSGEEASECVNICALGCQGEEEQAVGGGAVRFMDSQKL